MLAAADDVEGEGTRGTSAPARAWRTLRRSASREQALALLRHARAVPRARGAELVVARFPADTALLVPLLSDEAVVHVRTYDFGHATTVAAFVTDTLCRARYAAGDEVLLQTAREPGTAAVRARAAECLALRRRAEAWSALYGMLGSPDPKQLVVALGVIPAFDSPEGFERVSALASHLDANVRRATASALAGFCTLAAVRLLDTLLEDADASVRSRAFVVYVKHPLRDVEKVRHAFQGDRMETWAHDAAARIVGNQGLPESPGLIEAYLSRYPKSSDGVQQLAAYAPPMEASTRLFRKMLAESTDDHQRVSSIGYLGRAADRESLPLLEKSLKADWIIERDAAKEAILALGKTR